MRCYRKPIACKNLASTPALAPLSRFAALMLGVSGLSVTGLRPRLAGPPGGWAWPA